MSLRQDSCSLIRSAFFWGGGGSALSHPYKEKPFPVCSCTLGSSQREGSLIHLQNSELKYLSVMHSKAQCDVDTQTPPSCCDSLFSWRVTGVYDGRWRRERGRAHSPLRSWMDNTGGAESI